MMVDQLMEIIRARDGSTGPGDCPSGYPGEGGSFMSWTTDPDGGNCPPRWHADHDAHDEHDDHD